jgi:hypothetical protein
MSPDARSEAASEKNNAGGAVFRWLRRRRLSDAGRRRLLIALARAEEALVETHVRNVLRIHETVGAELTLERALELYLEALDPGEPHSSIVERRVLASVEGPAAARGQRGRRIRIEGEE